MTPGDRTNDTTAATAPPPTTQQFDPYAVTLPRIAVDRGAFIHASDATAPAPANTPAPEPPAGPRRRPTPPLKPYRPSY
ncbi:hypothetical protein GCM10009648_02800 [Tsukamurella spumae]